MCDAEEWRAVHIDEVVERCADLDAPRTALMYGETAMRRRTDLHASNTPSIVGHMDMDDWHQHL